MYSRKDPFFRVVILLTSFFFLACGHSGKLKSDEIVADPDQMNKLAAENIKTALSLSGKQEDKIDDSLRLDQGSPVRSFYAAGDDKPVWSSKEHWVALADTLYGYISHAELSGLFPNDYHFKQLRALKDKLDKDSLQRMDAVLWARADVMLTDAYMHIAKDLKQGRLKPDSISPQKPVIAGDDFYVNSLNAVVGGKGFTISLNALEPKHKGYWELKKGIKRFLDSMDRRTYTYVTYPYKKGSAPDSLFFLRTLRKRLSETTGMDIAGKLPDSLGLSNEVKKYQRQKGLLADGKINTALVRNLNINDVERFNRIAITLDRYKQLPETMPDKYIWVNLPGYYLQVWDHDTLALESKVICGKPDTRTPLLTSKITDMVTYPTWTVPNSIIVKSYLPKLKRNPNYISRLGLKLMNNKGEQISPGDINWAKYSKGIPYKIMQNSGDDNSLGVFKFNFNNPYSVYLHDTNQRYLFKNAVRDLSHGCVRVQEWEKLAFYIAKNDSLNSHKRDSLKYTTDSIRHWIAHKERHRIDVKEQIPLFIRYFTCEGVAGKISFYDDIYGEDKSLREKYFSNK